MSKDSSPTPAPPTAQETELTQKQIEAITLQLEQATDSAELAQALLSVMLQEAGYQYTPGPLIPEEEKPVSTATVSNAASAAGGREFASQQGPPIPEEKKKPRYGPPTITKLPQTESERLAQEVETEANKYSLAAIKGNLPVSPALERSIAGGEAGLRASMGQQLGPAWETGTPGIEALASERTRADTLREAVRFGQLSDLNAIAMAREGQRMGGAQQRYSMGAGATVPGLQAGGAIGAAGQAYSSPINTLSGERWNKYGAEMNQYNQKQARNQALIQMVMGAGTGYAATGTLAGTGFGAIDPKSAGLEYFINKTR